jgi:hypothetical protein
LYWQRRYDELIDVAEEAHEALQFILDYVGKVIDSGSPGLSRRAQRLRTTRALRDKLPETLERFSESP